MKKFFVSLFNLMVIASFIFLPIDILNSIIQGGEFEALIKATIWVWAYPAIAPDVVEYFKLKK